MTSTSTKEFGPIRSDYTFFEDHANEAAEDVRAYMPHVQPLATANRPIRMLDFGCGEGRLLLRFLESAEFPSENLSLSLVEPDDVYRRQAVERLQPLTTHPINAWPEIPSELGARFDLVLANHVFYYVSNLDDVVATIHGALAPSGLFLAAIAGPRNTLIQFWNHCFALIGKPVPYNTAEDFELALERQKVVYCKEEVQYELAFPDAEENRLSICRFLMGSYYPEVPRQAMVDLFNPYALDGKIAMSITHEHFVVRSAE